MATEAVSEEEGDHHRLAGLLLLIVLFLLGAGIGTFILPPNGAGPAVPPTDPIAGATETPTPTPDGPAGPPSPTSTAEPTHSPTPDETVTPSPTRTRTQTATPTRTPTTQTPTPETPTPTATPAPTPTPGDTPAPPNGGSSGGSSLALSGNGSIFAADDVFPGDSGTATVTLTNTGDSAGTLDITGLTVVDAENGVIEPELAVDSTPNEGELSENLEVRIAFQDAAGTRLYLFGTGDGYRPLADVAGESPAGDFTLGPGETVTVETQWRLPRSTGNEIQSDGVNVTMNVSLHSPDS